MVPGYLRGAFPSTRSRSTCTRSAAAGARFVEGAGHRRRARSRTRRHHRRRRGVHARVARRRQRRRGLDAVPGARAHALPLRPVREALALRARLDALLAPPATGAAAGLPAARPSTRGSWRRRGGGGGRARALHQRIAAARARAARDAPERAAHVLPAFPAAARARATSLLARRGVAVRVRTTVARVTADAVTLAGDAGGAAAGVADGERHPAQLVVWLAGAAAPALLAGSDLPRDADGFLRVDATLRAADGAPVWGAGDCVSLAGTPGAQGRVHAVRMAPVLDHNLRAALAGGVPRPYRPRGDVLALLDTADGRALLRWRGADAHARWAHWLKRAIDGRDVRRYGG
jgi:NADH dehydrogenase FAD-containing subunit